MSMTMKTLKQGETRGSDKRWKRAPSNKISDENWLLSNNTLQSFLHINYTTKKLTAQIEDIYIKI